MSSTPTSRCQASLFNTALDMHLGRLLITGCLVPYSCIPNRSLSTNPDATLQRYLQRIQTKLQAAAQQQQGAGGAAAATPAGR
jgi:hypothetical protein